VTDTDTLEQPAARIARLEAHNRRLQEAVHAANQEIDALSFSIAHDLRTPLLHIEASKGAVLDRENRDHLERLVGATRTMNELIGALVEYSRLSSAELVTAEVDLEQLLNEALGLVRPWSNGRSIQWHRTRLRSVYGDESLLRQVFVSLIANAVKYHTAARSGCHRDRYACATGAGNHRVRAGQRSRFRSEIRKPAVQSIPAVAFR
jgi:signal transduction histidine kinase